jgi:hypothetical protein
MLIQLLLKSFHTGNIHNVNHWHYVTITARHIHFHVWNTTKTTQMYILLYIYITTFFHLLNCTKIFYQKLKQWYLNDMVWVVMFLHNLTGHKRKETLHKMKHGWDSPSQTLVIQTLGKQQMPLSQPGRSELLGTTPKIYPFQFQRTSRIYDSSWALWQ